MVVAKSMIAEAVERPAGAAELVVHREVLEQRGLGVDVQGVHGAGRDVADRQPARDATLLVGQRVDVEHPGDALASLDLAEQDVLAGRRERQGQSGGDRRLAGAALAGDDVQLHAGPVGASDRGAVLAVWPRFAVVSEAVTRAL